MKQLNLKTIGLISLMSITSIVKSQWDPNWYPAPGFAPMGSDAYVKDAVPWAVGGNQVPFTMSFPNTNNYRIGTTDGAPFELMANGTEIIHMDQQGRVAIGTNFLPSINNCILDIKGSASNFRIFGDASGNVQSTTHMKLHFGNFTGASELQINDGAPGNATTRMLFNVWGAHIHTGGVFNGLFIGPSTSPWYNNSGSTRIWLDAVNSDGLAIVGGGGAKAIYVANSAGAGRFEMKINAGGGNDTKFKLGGSAQFGFYASVSTFEDPTSRVNVDAFSTDGVKVSTNSNGTKALYVNNSNFNSTTPNSFIVYGDGRTQIGPNYPEPSGVANGAMLSVNGMILAKDVRVAIGFGNGAHWKYADYVFEKNYKLMSLADVEKYVTKNKHLPDVPGEAEVIKNGMGLAEMNIALLKKVEELYLHLIELNTDKKEMQIKMDELISDAKKQDTKLEKMQEQMSRLKAK